MTNGSTWGSDGSPELLVEIVETLDACGLDRDEYQLLDFVHVEALEQLVTSSSSDLEIQFTVEGIRLSVTSDTVCVLVGNRQE